ncbi:MAG: hypothetical protein NVS1B4_23020 [Gemmatimonadaceae bacterium]
MPTPESTPPEHVSTSRAVAWAALAIVLVVGLVLYFLYGDAVLPLITSKPG